MRIISVSGNKFNKQQKLCSALKVQEVMQQGQGLVTFPMRWRWQWVPRLEGKPQLQLLVWAPKRLFHHAVDRNRMRRLMREAYRLHQAEFQPLLDTHPSETLLLCWHYMDTKLCELNVIEKAVKRGLGKLS